MKIVSVVVSVKQPSAPSHLYPGSRKSIVLVVTKRNSLPDALNATR